MRAVISPPKAFVRFPMFSSTAVRSLSCASLLVLSCSLVACGGAKKNTKNLSYGENAKLAYETALKEYRKGDCADAEPGFRDVRKRYPYSSYAALAELRVADCQLKEKKYTEAIQGYQRFIRFRPSHPHIPYARFKVADAYYRQIPRSWWFFTPPTHERDQSPARDALRYLRRFIEDFPRDVHVPEAKKMAQGALAVLANHELYVARFYLRRDAPKAAITRIQVLLRDYSGSGVEPEALLLLGKIYRDQKDLRSAGETFQMLVERFPRSEEAGDARKELARLRASSSLHFPTKQRLPIVG